MRITPYLLLCYLIFGLNGFLSAQKKISWAANGLDDWNIATNWDCDCIPSSLDTVLIEHDSVFIGSADAFAAKVVLGNVSNNPVGLKILVNGSLKISSNVDRNFYIYGDQSKFRNSGDLIVSGAQQEGIRFEGLLFENKSSGSIEVTFTNSTGIFVDTTSSFVNEGRIDMVDSGQSGIWNTGSFTNDGKIYIDNNGTGFNNWASDYTPTFTNSDSLVISNAYTGIYNLGMTDNLLAGIILIEDLSGKGILNPGDFTNTGVLKIHQTEGDGIDISNNGSFINQNFISLIKTSQDGANHGIENNGYIQNDLGAIIVIDSSGQYGIQNINTLINTGTIQISNISSIGLFNNKFLSNQDVISVDQAETGFYNSLNSEAYNVGTITITNSATTPFEILQNSIFENILSGSLNVQN